ncbi:hypothetical protein V6Z11_A07G013500 [Gossypium hirsutum]|uniref:Lycopene epsilon cyclase, chloroplastic isoform X1 n=2 Tax=Gossypium hirsutum TaxID=3635 RepID=A0ABM3C153_GOSHI|nr:lycopene epsilon cyclase, chloroplastic-like isoform X1 [Gossypium hirsutum]
MMITTSVGARNFEAVAVSKSATWRSHRRKDPVSTKMAVSNNQRLISLDVSGSGAVRESYVAVKEGFADEEDYVKAGGSQLLFVQMQQHKEMDEQSKLADKLPPISIEDNILDLVVIGSGPAGLALAAESAKLGLNVGLISPDLPFTNNYGLWEDEIKDLGLEKCMEHVWPNTIVYLDDDKPITIGRAYGRVDRRLLHEELLKRCVESGVMYLSSKVESIVEAIDGHNLVACEYEHVVPCRLVVVASGAASGKLLQYEVGGPRVAMQSAYGIEVEVENNPYDPSMMVFMDYRDYAKEQVPCLQDQYPSFLYGMPMSSTRVFFEETCLALKEAVPMDFLKKKLMSRLRAMRIRIVKVYEEEWSYVPLGGSLPNMKQKNLAFGAAASMVHPATGYSIARSLSEAPNYASVIEKILKRDYSKGFLTFKRNNWNMSIEAWNTLWPQERKRQRSFFLLGLALLLQLDTEGSRTFFRIFFRLPSWMWQGFLGSTLSSIDLVVFAFSMFVTAPMDMKMLLIRHLLKDPTATTMINEDVKAPNIFERAKEEIEAVIHVGKIHPFGKETHGKRDDINENTPLDDVKAPNVFERVKEEFEALVETVHHKKESQTHVDERGHSDKEQAKHDKPENGVKAPNLIERAKEEIGAIFPHDKSSNYHHKETHGKNNDIDETTPLNEVKAPNVFERAKEEIEAIVGTIHPKIGSNDSGSELKEGGFRHCLGMGLEKVCHPWGSKRD